MEPILITVILLLLLIIIANILALFVKVPVAHYGVETCFGKRTGKKFKEGLHLFSIPFFSKMLLYPISLKTYTFDDKEAIVVFSADELEITIEGAVLTRPSWKNLLKFVEIPESTIIDGMKDAIEGGLGIIAGQENAEDFIKRRKEIEYIINCLFSLERRPDFYLNGLDPESFSLTKDGAYKRYIENIEECIQKESDAQKVLKIQHLVNHLKETKWEINEKKSDPNKANNTPELDVLDFYKKNVKQIETMLQLEDLIEQNSKIENFYSINIESFKLAKVTYSQKTKESLEKKKQAEKDLAAAKLRQEMKMDVMEKLIKKGVPPSQASNDADAIVGIAPKQTIAGNVIPFINLPGGKTDGK